MRSCGLVLPPGLSNRFVFSTFVSHFFFFRAHLGSLSDTTSEQKLILGTHTADGEPNYLMIANVRLPLEDKEQAVEAKGGDEDDEVGRYGGPAGKVDVNIQIPHDGEVNRCVPGSVHVFARHIVFRSTHVDPSFAIGSLCNVVLSRWGPRKQSWKCFMTPARCSGCGSPRSSMCLLMFVLLLVCRARYMPQNSFIIATKSPNADVLVFEYSRHDSHPKDTVCRPELRLTGHTMEGYGLDWSPLQQGRIVSGGDDTKICIWDIAPGASGKGSTVQPLTTLLSHTAVVEVGMRRV
jgi:hypothetical protein